MFDSSKRGKENFNTGINMSLNVVELENNGKLVVLGTT